MKLKLTLIALVVLLQLKLTAQENSNPTFIQKASKMTVVQSLASRTNLIPAPVNLGEAKDKKSWQRISIFR
jgi:hypothetical protein